jgi:Flp pilus assembly protein TadG
MIEAAVVMVLISFLLLGVVEVSRVFAAKQILDHAASTGARAQAVGFNEFMTYKVVRAATIPNAGPLVTPDLQRPGSNFDWGTATAGDAWDQAIYGATTRSHTIDTELARVPLYLGTTDWNQLPGTLDYEDWDTVRWPVNTHLNGMVSTVVRQDFPLHMPMHRAFYNDDEVELRSRAWQADHQSLYLEGQ